ncbi:hypothetical protein [Streptomyces sp. NBC_01763]|uniref:hypothetical protein n=1 Tax=Streptomyces sp. NBC_01763 TaxID=2975934 RepID=UPI002DDA78B4|nr:hypothetical protein [Streptomyces sp. NBC_01763]WSC40330.1 hypothetical protein OHA08_35110 [Streptomyces sp. NBC_01763]
MHDQYKVKAEPPLSPPGTPVGLLGELAAALNMLGRPTVDTLNAVTVDMIELAFNSVTSRQRQDLLRGLGIRLAAPRRASKSLCRDVLNRLRREATERDCVCSVRGLTVRVMIDTMNLAHQVPPGEAGADPIARWGETLVSLAVFAWCDASVAHARLIVWMADRNWLGIKSSGEALDAVREAAVRVVEATSDLHDGPVEGQSPGARPPMSGPQAESVAELPLQNASQEPPMPDGVQGIPDPWSAYEALEVLVQDALTAAHRIGETLGGGCPPDEGDLRLLSAIDPAFTQVQEALAAVGLGPVPDRLEDLARSAGSHRATRDEEQAARKHLTRLLTVSCDGASPAKSALDAAQSVAAHLLEQPAWDEPERRQGEALSALFEIVELRERADALAQIATRQRLIGQTLPECAMAALMHNDLSLPVQMDIDPAVDDPGEDHAPRSSPEPVAGSAERESRTVSASIPTPRKNAAEESDPLALIPAAVDSAVDPAAAEVAVHAAADMAGNGADGHTTPVTAGPPSDVATRVPDHDVAAERAIARLVSEERFGLAAHLSHAVERSEAEAAALRLAAAAAVLCPGSASGARTMGAALQEWDALGSRDVEGAELILLPALLRAALITGEHAAGAQLKALAPRLPEGLAPVAIAVADRALNSALLIASPMTVRADASESEAGLRDITEQCGALLKPQRLRYNRATHIAKRWLAADGMLGGLLTAIVNGDPGAPDAARETVGRLSRLTEIHTEIDVLDRELRGPGGRPLQGSGRQDLVHVVERVVDCAKAWLDTTEALRRGGPVDNDWAVREISALRKTVLGRRDRALADLETMAKQPSPILAAAARAAQVSLCGLFDDLEHGAAPLPGMETEPRRLIDAELLKIPGLHGEKLSASDLYAAVDRTWSEALDLQTKGDGFDAAYSILDLFERGALPGAASESLPAGTRKRVQDLEVRRRSELSARHDELAAELRRAQADGAVADDQDVKLQELLADAHPLAEDGTARELGVVREILDRVAKLLPQYREEATDRLRSRLDALPDLIDEERAQVLRHLDTGGLATAADLVYFLELGEPVPEIEAEDSHLADFFPAVPAGLPSGITTELITAVRSRGRLTHLPVLDYAHLSVEEATRAAEALVRWRELSTIDPKERQNINVRVNLLPALSLLGYEARRARPLDDLPRSNEYRFADVLEIQINGRAWAPAFGTRILDQGGTLRVLMLWGSPSAQLLLSRAAKEPSGESLLVAYFGTLTREARAELAAASADRAPLMVVDDASLAYLAARGNRQVSVATETLLPFSGVNPYIKEKRGRIGREMFYGRDAERKGIIDPYGTQIIFGGRGLGKSALLNDAGERFAEQQPGHHHPVYLNLDHHNIGKGNALGAETIWNVLDRELTRQEVLPPQRRKGRGNDSYERVRSGVNGWLAEDRRRRLLILMDECDRFFEADTPHCTQTRRLKGLCEETPGRMKVVFAGLHSVQRFTRLARNGPFSHLAQTPTVVGPLAPQFAADLLALPLRALGFEFADVDLVNRALGYCSYQPFLLQMFGSRLVEVMQRRRARGEGAGPPYAIEAADLEAVESDPSLRADITAAFKDTLTLDDRYNVIANVLARHARDHGLEMRLSDAELRDECTSWWRAGFEHLDSEGFRAYLQEMVGLGVLAPNHDGRGWHLRGPNALRMIGTAQDVEAQLLRAETDCALEETVVLEGRPELSGGRSAPLTVTQVDDLLGDRVNQTRIVLGTLATCVDNVTDTLRDVTGRVKDWQMPTIGRLSVFRQELTAGHPGDRRLIVSDLASRAVNEESCTESLDLALTILPDRPGVTRAVVLVAGTGQLGLWRKLLLDPDTAASAAVVLRRHDRRGLKSWSMRSEMFDTEDRLSGLMDATGGWPLLLDRVVEAQAKCQDQDQALRRVTDELKQKGYAADLVEAVGLTADPMIAAGYRSAINEFGDGWFNDEDLVTAIELEGMEEPEARWVAACLQAFQVFDRQGSRLRLERVVHDCWLRSA